MILSSSSLARRTGRRTDMPPATRPRWSPRPAGARAERAGTPARLRCAEGSCSWSRSEAPGSAPRATPGRCRSDDLLQVVEEKERLPVADQRDHALAKRPPFGFLHVERLGERGKQPRGSLTSASETKATPSRNSGASMRPSSASTVVFPTPPGPVIVTTRCCRARSTRDSKVVRSPERAARPPRASCSESRRTVLPCPRAPPASGTTRPSPLTA